MKKKIWISILLAVSLLLIACGSGTEPEEGGTISVESSQHILEESLVSIVGTSSKDSSFVSDDLSGEESLADQSGGESNDEIEISQDASGDESIPEESSQPSEQSKPESSSSGTSSETSKQQPPENDTHTHSYKETIVKPTCTEKGYTLHKCSCGDSYKDKETAALGHDLATGNTTKMPTETTRGKTIWNCSRCSYQETTEQYSLSEYRVLVTDRMIYWVNRYRAEEGAKPVAKSDKLTELSQYRANQALQGGAHKGHNIEDGRKAAEAVKCGTFHDYTFVDPESGEVYPPFWEAAGMEAYAGISWSSSYTPDVGDTDSIDSFAKRIADLFRSSPGHWAYVGAKGLYVGVGISSGNCFVIVCDYNPDESGYLHIYEGNNGDLVEEWTKG